RVGVRRCVCKRLQRGPWDRRSGLAGYDLLRLRAPLCRRALTRSASHLHSNRAWLPQGLLAGAAAPDRCCASEQLTDGNTNNLGGFGFTGGFWGCVNLTALDFNFTNVNLALSRTSDDSTRVHIEL